MTQILEQPMKNYPTIDCIRQAIMEDLEERARFPYISISPAIHEIFEMEED